jgi:phosphomannomutase
VHVNPGIFKAYDIRGLYPSEINEAIAGEIGRAFVSYLGARRIGVSRDMRLSSPTIAAAFIEGALAQGCDVIDYGMLATDMLYYAVASEKLEGGAQITASNNPGEHKGIKMVRHEALPLSGDAGIGEIRDMVSAGRVPPQAATPGRKTSRDIVEGYVDLIMRFIDPGIVKPFKVVADAGNGMAGIVAPRMFARLPCQVIEMCFTPDGSFPNHEANPLIEENRAHIVDRVVQEKADIGIAWDGDADRCFFIDGTGEFIPGDFITALLAEAFLLKHPNATIVYDLRASRAVKDTVEHYGGTALMNRVGHAFIKRRMRDDDAIFGGEVTGHYYFRDFFYADNGFIPALLMLELMSKKNQSLADLLAPLRAKYFISGEINTKVSSMEVAAERMKAVERHFAGASITKLDGVSVEFDDWHFNVRGSNTEPLLRLNVEARTPELMAEKRDEVLAVIRD